MRGRRRQSGFSLVVVLAALAVMSLLMVALLTGASHQLRSGQNDAYLAREKMLSDSAVALVIRQIQQAATQPNQAWISQPGLLRTYSAAQMRVPTASYKLYSASQMVDTSGGVTFLASDVPGDWNSTANHSVYTDLNAPVQPLFGPALYPILDAGAAGSTTGLSSDTGHAVEMPVAWIYQLQDGTLGAPSSATAANPIVGRIAFWTDDESSKIDINTAGEGSPWNTPHAFSADDVAWATTQPAHGEFERYPGHPGGVSLSTVFGLGTAATLTPDQLLSLTPRYSSGGSDFGANATTATSVVPFSVNRLYGSLDELCFGPTLNASGQRVANPITPVEINTNRFVLTAHSHSPETTLLGEPRIAIWPVSDSDPQRTATDRAVASDATVGAGTATSARYFFQRHDATSSTADLDRSIVPDNATLWSNLVATGSEQLPGYGTTATFSQKYPGTQWPQIALELLDAIRGFNSVDPTPAPFVPFAATNENGSGLGLVVPLTAASGTTPLRGLGRYPTLWGLTLVLYVSGYDFTDGSSIDYEQTPDTLQGESWLANLAEAAYPASRWKQVSKALVRAFVVPTTFQPGCAFPEVSDACSIQIGGLDQLTATYLGTTQNFGFKKICKSHLLSDALSVLPADRSWGGFEGPQAWRAAYLDAMSATGARYVFAGQQAIAVPCVPQSRVAYDSKTGGPSQPQNWGQTLTVNALPNLTVQILDANATVIQTLTLNLPSFSGQTPTIDGEADHYDGATPDTSHADWATNSAYHVFPSYYMTLRNRLLATQRSRSMIIQAGDMSYSVESRTDPRLVASLASVPASFFGPSTTTKVMADSSGASHGGTHQHDLRFADGTSACWVTTQQTQLANAAYATTTGTIPVTNWRTGTSFDYPYATSPACSAPTGSATVTMSPPSGPVSTVLGDWDTGIGVAPDGALNNLPDAGSTLPPAQAYQGLSGGQVGAPTLRSPNALIPSPVVFGSLPAGINPSAPTQSQPWRTLLFCPYPLGDQAHPGLVSPPDYLLLDRFWMPVVEPYGISTCMETAGKINLNDQIAPFTYLHRSTALHALLHGLRIPAIASTATSSFKTATGKPVASIWNSVDETATIQQIENRFANGDAYLTEGEVCSVPLVPLLNPAISPGALEAFWTSQGGGGYLTGDNLRELPYAQLYGRLTTRSNSYTVHVRAQVLQKLHDGTAVNVWREGVDRVLGDWRGSYEIERYLDPAATAPAAGQPLGPYKVRIVSARRFTP